MAHTISLSDARRDLDRSLLQAPGGFAWWYLDHVDAQGDGVVMIWSFGLPFLPGYLGAARAGRPQPAGARPSLNVVLYEAGRPSFYLLQEYAPERCRWTPDAWQLGDSSLALHRAGDRALLRAELDCPIPGSTDRLSGEIRCEGQVARFATAPEPRPEHEWSPVLGPSILHADLRIGDRSVQRAGLAYHDRNGGRLPLDGLGISRWTWGRWVEPDAISIFYVLWPEAGGPPEVLGVHVGADGQAELREDLLVTLEGHQRGTYGMPYVPRLALFDGDRPWLDARTQEVIDDGPFYLRTLLQGEDGAYGLGEWVAPKRVDRPWQRPFVRMRVHHADASNSAWLPLFSGPRQGRLQRLVGGPRA